jgi:hypothetical protein
MALASLAAQLMQVLLSCCLQERGRPDGWVSVPISDPATSILDDLK